MKRYTAISCAYLTLLSGTVPLAAMAKHEEHAAPAHHSAPAHHAAPEHHASAPHREAPHPAEHRAAPRQAEHREAPHAEHREAPREKAHPEENRARSEGRGEPRNERGEQDRSSERRNEQQNERKSEERQERKPEGGGEPKEERKAEEQQHKDQERSQKEQEKEQRREQKEERKSEEHGGSEEGMERNQRERGGDENRKEGFEGNRGANENRREGFEGNHGANENRREGFDGNHGANENRREGIDGNHGADEKNNFHGFAPRRSGMPPALHVPRVPLHQASPMPFFHAHLNGEQQAQAQLAQQNLQHHLYAINANQAPSGYQQYGPAQVNNYLNSNYQTSINNQPVYINSGNTYTNPFPSSGWPSWYQGSPGWGFTNGLVFGAIRAGLNWLRWGWPHYYGAPPAGFMYQNGYVPTPWMYVPWANQWRQPSVMGYASEGPPNEYTMPITVQVVEPVQTTMTDPATGESEPTTINQVIMYNAYYYPRFGRWGYMNRQGYFIWVDPTNANDNANPNNPNLNNGMPQVPDVTD